jgi:hypothetical protein
MFGNGVSPSTAGEVYLSEYATCSRLITVVKPVSQSWCQAPSGAQDQIFHAVRQLQFC